MKTNINNFFKAARCYLHPQAASRVVLHYWSPGYKLQKKFISQEGKEVLRKVFKPTSTFEAAIAHLKNEYGNQEYLKYKEDAHPGHIAVETDREYLSIGTNEPINAIGITTSHQITFSKGYESDLIAFTRLPESILDFYTLDIHLVEKAIQQLNNSDLVYSIIGNRVFKAEGESCATSGYICLEAGGITNLLRTDQWLLSKHSILTPHSLRNYAEKARNRERSLFVKSETLSNKYIAEKVAYSQKVLEKYLTHIGEHHYQPVDSQISSAAKGGTKK